MNFRPLFVLLGVLFAAVAMAQPSSAPEDQYVRDAAKVARDLVGARDVYDQILAAGALAEVGDATALEFLARCIGQDDIVVKRSAIDTLLSASHPNSMDLLFRSTEGHPDVLSLVMESLASTPRQDMEDLLLRGIHESSLFVQKHSLQAAARADARRLHGEIRKLVADPATDPMIRAYGYYALASGDVDGEVAAKILTLATSEAMQEQEVAAVALGNIDTVASKAALAQLAKQTEQRVSLAAIASSAGLGDEEAVARTIKLIAYGTPMESTVMASALKRMPSQMASQITRVLLTCCDLKADGATRLLESWGWISGDPGAIYQWGLAHREPDVRLQTLWLIGQRKDATQLANVARFLTDEDPALRGMAAWTIMHTAPERYVPGVET